MFSLIIWVTAWISEDLYSLSAIPLAQELEKRFSAFH